MIKSKRGGAATLFAAAISFWGLTVSTQAQDAIAGFADADFNVIPVVDGLDHPWSLSFLPNNDMLVTTKGGDLFAVRDGVLDTRPISGVPEVYTIKQAGLFEANPHPNFAENNLIYLTYAHGTNEANRTRLARARLEGNSLVDLEVIFEVTPTKNTGAHYGGRMTFLDDGTILLTTGDGFMFKEKAQLLDNHLGKIVRVNDDGSVPADNPFVDTEGALPEIWSYGHRNAQGIVFDAVTGTVYQNEHGARGGDEVNIIRRGRNYGWPLITHGVDYTGAKVTPFTEMEGLEQPIVDWTPSIAPSGLEIYHGGLFPAWEGDLFSTALALRKVVRVDLEDGKVVGQEDLLGDMGERFRDVRVGPDGALYLIVDGPDGRILKLTPVNPPPPAPVDAPEDTESDMLPEAIAD